MTADKIWQQELQEEASPARASQLLRARTADGQALPVIELCLEIAASIALG